MRGLWLQDGRAVVRDDLPRPRPGRGEALVRVVCAGICGTDLQLLRGYTGFCGIPGHEFVGRVVGGPRALAGARVVAEINVACGRCRQCRAGRRRHCERRKVIGIRDHPGALAEYVAVPVANLHRLPASVSDEAATFVEPLAAALRICEQLEPTGLERILVIGDGRLGQLVARALRATGQRAVFVLGRHEQKLARLRQVGIPAATAAPAGRFDIVVECTGSPDGLAEALGRVRPEGTIVLKSTYVGAPPAVDMSACVVDELRLVGSRCGEFGPAIALLADGRLDPTPLIDARYPLERAPEALAAAAAGALKVLVHVQGAG